MAYLRHEGLTVNVGKAMTVQAEEMPYAIKTGQLGEIYTLEAIRKRLEAKYDSFKSAKAGNYYANILPEELMNFKPNQMKPYKEMTKEEKVEIVRLLRLGRNPWQEAKADNWQLQSAADELKNVGYVYKLVNHYSKGSMNANEAMEAIIAARKKISSEKKELRNLAKEYKPITGIYQEMKTVMTRACLYDLYGRQEFKAEFEKYFELGKRLELGYGKSVEEVAELVFELKSKKAYLEAQDKQLSAQYKAIKDYVNNGKLEAVCDDYSFFKLVGHSQAVYDAKHFGIYGSSIKEIRPVGKDIKIRVITTPSLKDGKAAVETQITVIDKHNNCLKDVSSQDFSEREFNQEIYEIQCEYGIKKCEVINRTYSDNARHI
ncbi:MAG: hypothetical protein HUJ70_08990 [Pseudobutyrivibrio sp.]|nr:hypothetical protein [Pseudobutyrivibrio sp.]